MGNCVGGFKKRTKKLKHRKKVRNIRICVLGLDGAGKSTAIRAIASEDITGVLPTNGFTLEEFKYQKAEIIAYDLGGGERIRSIWKNYYSEVFGVIYVIDGSEERRISESGELLKEVISDERLSGKPVLVVLNKVDREGCIDEIQLTDRLDLHHMANLYRTQIRVEVCQSNAGTGKMVDLALKDGFEWLLERIYDDYERLEKKVNEALQQLKRRQDEERMRRQHRLAATVSSSSSSDEKPSAAGAGAAAAAADVQQEVPAAVVAQPDADHVVGTEHEIEPIKRRRLSRNVVSPTGGLTVRSMEIDSGRMKHPEIFEVSSRHPPALPPLKGLKEIGETTNGQPYEKPTKIDSTGESAELQTTTKPVRGAQLIPLSVIPNRQPKEGVRPRRRIDSV